jgi:hypothetical protein
VRARITALALSALLLGMLLPLQLSAQGAGAGSLIQTYRFGDANAAGLETIQLITSPFAVSVPLGSSFSIDVSGAYARGTATGPDGRQATLSGLTDTYVGVNAGVGLDWLVISAGATLPTGKDTHTLAESLVAAVIAAELLPFAINTWGSGGSVGGTVAAARQAGGWGIGLSGGYRVASEYEPLRDQTLGYRPGNQLQFRIALDHDVGASGTFSVLLGFQSFGNDQLSGNELFRSGNRFQGVLSYAFAVGLRSSALVYGGVNHRANGTLLRQGSALGGATDSPSQQLFLAGTNVRFPVGRRAVLLPNAEIRVFRAEDGASQGWVSSAGATFDVRVAGSNSGRRVVLAPTAQFRLGRVIVEQGLETGLVGWEVGATLRIEFGR